MYLAVIPKVGKRQIRKHCLPDSSSKACWIKLRYCPLVLGTLTSEKILMPAATNKNELIAVTEKESAKQK